MLLGALEDVQDGDTGESNDRKPTDNATSDYGGVARLIVTTRGLTLFASEI